MDWWGKVLELIANAILNGLAKIIPEHWKKRLSARLGDINPNKSIVTNDDLKRALRRAWIEAAQEVLKTAGAHLHEAEWASQAGKIQTFQTLAQDVLTKQRDAMLDRRMAPSASPVDAYLPKAIEGVAELAPRGGSESIDSTLTTQFTSVLSQLTDWPAHEIPAIFQQIAENGLVVHGIGAKRTFGETAIDAFAELLKNPTAYPEARQAFTIAAQSMGNAAAKTALAAATKIEIQNREILDRLAAEKNVSVEFLRVILAEMGEAADKLDASEIAEKLRAKADEFKALQDRLNRLTPDDSDVIRFRRLASEALEKGRFAEADSYLVAAESRDLEGVEDLEALAKQKRLSAAETRAERAQIAKLRANEPNYREAANHFGEAARIAKTADAEAAFRFELAKGKALVDLGTEFASNAALEEAITHFNSLLVDHTRTANARDWAQIMHNLGNAQSLLGEREPGVGRLEEAQKAFDAALEIRTRDAFPLDWAMTQNSLGNVLLSLGKRNGAAEQLAAAKTAFDAALSVWTQGDNPWEWAMAQNGLGNVLQALGQIEQGTELLEQAASAYRAALQEWTQKKAPLDWAGAQSNLGTVLWRIGERTGDIHALKDAISAFEAALKVFTQSRVPPFWAMVQNNLGNALLQLAKHENSAKALDSAIVAFQKSLEERRRDVVPLDWAMTQYNLGNAFVEAGKTRNDPKSLTMAIEAFEWALKERTREADLGDWAVTQNNRGDALRWLGCLTGKPEPIEKAIRLFREVLSEPIRERNPPLWAMIQSNLGEALHTLGEWQNSLEHLEASAEAFRFAFEELKREHAPGDWAKKQCNYGNTLEALGKREAGTDRLEQAALTYCQALEEMSEQQMALDRAGTLGNLGSTLLLIAERNMDIARAKEALPLLKKASQFFGRTNHQEHAAILSKRAQLARDLIAKLRKPS